MINISKFAVVAILLVASHHESQSAVIFTFEQIGPDVMATTSGSMFAPSGFDAEVTTLVTDEQYGDGFYFYRYAVPGYRGTSFAGILSATSLSVAPTSSSGDSFGFTFSGLIFPLSVNADTSFSPNTSLVWANQTLSDIGLGGLSNTPLLVWNGAYGIGNDILFASAVPEPAVSTVSILAGCALLVRRRR